MKHYVAIDIGGTNIKYGLINEAETLVEAHEMPTEAHKGGPGIMQKVEGIVAAYLEKGPIAGICISSAGMVDPDKGEIFYAGPQIPLGPSSKKCWKKNSPCLVRLKMMSTVLAWRRLCRAAARDLRLPFV